jgi:hypothetical protein
MVEITLADPQLCMKFFPGPLHHTKWAWV